jgi:hypothetical protein
MAKRPASACAGQAGFKRSKRCLRAYRQAAEEPPGEPRVVRKNDPLSLGNHPTYIANRSGFDNEAKSAAYWAHPGSCRGAPQARRHTQW